jgi:TonB family protein
VIRLLDGLRGAGVSRLVIAVVQSRSEDGPVSRLGDGLFGWPVLASAGAHLAALTVVSMAGVTLLGTETPPPVSVDLIRPVDLLQPVDLTRKEAPTSEPKREKLPPLEPPPGPRAEEPTAAPRIASTPVAAPTLMDDRPLTDALRPAERQPVLAGAILPSRGPAIAGPSEGGPAGTGALLETGDLAARPGTGTDAGGRSGLGTGTEGSGTQVALNGGGVTDLARPLGGYQTTPRYPEAARREGIEGVTTLRFQVLTTGSVGAVVVARSAGHRDLDRAAVDAIKSWRFEPARRGKEAVTVWVTLPVRFELTGR